MHACIGAFLDLDRLAAADGASKAMGMPLEDRLGDALAGDAGSSLLPVSQAPVADGQVSGLFRSRHAARCPELCHAQRVGLNESVYLFHKVQEGFSVGVLRLVPTADHNSLEILRAKDRTHTTPPGGAGVPEATAHHVSKAHQVLTCGSNAGHLRLLISLLMQLLNSLVMLQPPEVRCGSYLCGAVIDPNIDRLGSSSGDDQTVVSRKPQFGAPVPAHVRFIPYPGQGRTAAP